jgi:hypothetical protein
MTKEVLGKLVKGFLFGGVGSIIVVLEANGCKVHNLVDLQTLAVTAGGSFITGVLHAAWYYAKSKSLKPEITVTTLDDQAE